MVTVDDVYCKFGFVAEAAQLLETELGTLLLEAVATESGLIEEPNASQATDLLNKINSYTLGKLIRNSKASVDSIADLEKQLIAALKERNRLSHSFYREHNFRLHAQEDKGRTIMLEDLDRMHSVIWEAHKSVMLLSGIDLDNLENLSQEYQFTDVINHAKIL